MKESFKKDLKHKEVTDLKTFTVPYTLEEIKNEISCLTNKPTKISKQEIINKAFNFHSIGNITEAKRYYQYCLNKGFNDARVFSNYGTILKRIGSLEEAKLYTQKAIEIKPDFAEAYYNLSGIFKELGQLEKAEIAQIKAIKIKPDYAEAHNNLGTILIDLGQLKEAELYTRKAIEIKPNYAMAHCNLGTILKDLGQLQEAELSTRKAIEIQPNLANAHLNLGNILNSLGKPKEAESHTREAIKIKPNYAIAYNNLGGIMKELGKLKKAELYTRKAIEIKTNYAEAYYNLGAILNALGKRNEAIKSLEKAVSLKPNDEKPIIVLAHHLCNEKKYEFALEYLIKNKSIACQSLYLGCLLSLDREKDFNEKYKELSKKKACNADIGGIVEHANIIYNKEYKSPFCNKAIKYILIDKINEESFSEKHLKELIAYSKTSKKEARSQGLLTNGMQTSGNLLLLDYPFIKSIKKALELKIKEYKQKFQHSDEGFIRNWPATYTLRAWMISMKSGGYLEQHNHEYGWITGSFYLQIPRYKKNNDSGKIAFSYEGPRYPNKNKNFNLTIKNIEKRDICIFPSSLFHQTIPFKSTEERICFVFDLI